MDQGGVGRDEEKRSGIGTTKQRRRRQQRRSVLLFLCSFHIMKGKIWLIVVSLFLLSFYSSQSVEYNNRWTRAERDGEDRTDQDETNTDGDRNVTNGYVLYYF